MRNLKKEKLWSIISRFKQNNNKIYKVENKEMNVQNFANFYEDLFSHKKKPNNFEQEKIKIEVKDYYESLINLNSEFLISTENIKNIISKLSKGKSAGFDNITNEFFIYGLNSNLQCVLYYFFNLAISFGYLPDNFNISLVTSIPKKGNLNSPSDYRPISVSSTFSVIFESILLSNMECFNDIHSNQFGNRKKSSCKQAHFLVNETINYYTQGGSKLHLVSLDATKAFDKLGRDGLFFKLIGKIPKELW
ncbi:unnamed protein product [Brachionus calyciflorus]|uniref:Reverse transcriptase domain-containing protein n=1 Tax=Brachionus calyciflorus TaxID=104777 RepID=A0A813W244_9BILA|nr:unnamed protein product [Brachionus calyciflorus]